MLYVLVWRFFHGNEFSMMKAEKLCLNRVQDIWYIWIDIWRNKHVGCTLHHTSHSFSDLHHVRTSIRVVQQWNASQQREKKRSHLRRAAGIAIKAGRTITKWFYRWTQYTVAFTFTYWRTTLLFRKVYLVLPELKCLTKIQSNSSPRQVQKPYRSCH